MPQPMPQLLALPQLLANVTGATIDPTIDPTIDHTLTIFLCGQTAVASLLAILQPMPVAAWKTSSTLLSSMEPE